MSIVKIFTTILLALFFGFNLISQNYNPTIDSLINQVSQDSLISYVRILSGEDSVYVNGQKEIIAQRVYNTNDLAADYLFEKMSSFGLSPEKQEYADDGTNIITIQEGYQYPDEYYMICAHYDGVTTFCADDNASGSATVLETARILSTMELPYSIIYALFDEEEIGLIGSNDYADKAATNEMKILGVINIDMIGWDSDDDGLIEIHSREIGTSEFITETLIAVNDDYELMLDPEVQLPGTGASDHSSFWYAGYGAVLLIEGYYSGDFNPYYHSPDDRIEIFNLEYFHNAAQLAFGATTTLAYGDQAVGIQDFSQNNNPFELICYPNPSKNKITIQFTLPEDNLGTISLINHLGQKIQLAQKKFGSGQKNHIEFDVSEYPAGLYSVLLNSGNRVSVRNIIVVK